MTMLIKEERMIYFVIAHSFQSSAGEVGLHACSRAFPPIDVRERCGAVVYPEFLEALRRLPVNFFRVLGWYGQFKSQLGNVFFLNFVKVIRFYSENADPSYGEIASIRKGLLQTFEDSEKLDFNKQSSLIFFDSEKTIYMSSTFSS